MTDNQNSGGQNSVECNVVCWAIAAFVGFVSMIMLYMLAEFSALQAIFTGGLVGTVLGLVLSLFICRGQTAAADLQSDEKPAQRYAREAAEDAQARGGAVSAAPAGGHNAAAAPAGGGHNAAAEGAGASGGGTAAAASATAAPLMGSGVKPSAPLAGEAELAARKGDWKYESDAGASGGDTGSSVDQSKAVPAGETAAPAVAPDADAVAAAEVVKAPAGDSGAKAKRAPVAADGKPTLYDAPPAEGADDLKLISGVGPKLEGTLNEMGIYRFEQVAGWRKKEIEWVDARLRFKGRIERDDWMSQAKILAKGGETEFSRKKKK